MINVRLRKGYKIVNDRGRIGLITEFGWKNGERTISFDGIEGTQSGWCYRSQILEVYKPNGEKVPLNQVAW